MAKAFGVVLRECRDAAGLTQEELAHEVGIERTYISFLERGLQQPTLGVLMALAASLGITASELVAKAEARIRR